MWRPSLAAKIDEEREFVRNLGGRGRIKQKKKKKN